MLVRCGGTPARFPERIPLAGKTVLGRNFDAVPFGQRGRVSVFHRITAGALLLRIQLRANLRSNDAHRCSPKWTADQGP